MPNMEFIHTAIKSVEPMQYVYGVVAIFGGVARYLTGYANGTKFKFSVFIASAFTAGFSGWIFAQIGISLNFSMEWIFVLSGIGGFFSEQTMKFILEWVQEKVK